MECPQCNEVLVKAFVETGCQYGWMGCWLCACDKEDYERNVTEHDGDIVIVPSYSKLGAEVNRILQGG